MAIRAARWKRLLKQEKIVPLGTVLSALGIGFMVNNVLPAKIGELVRAEFIARKEKLSRGFALGTVFVERMLDVLLLVFFLFISVIFSRALVKIIYSNRWSLFLIIFLIFFILFFLINKKYRERIFLIIIPKKFQTQLSNFFSKLSKSVSFLKKKKVFTKIIIQTMAMWLCTVLSYFIIIKGMGVSLPLYAYLFIVSASTIGMVIPSSPGNIGVYHAVAMGSIMVFMVDKDTALAIAIIVYAFDLIPNIIFGTVVLLKENISVLKIYRKNLIQNEG